MNEYFCPEDLIMYKDGNDIKSLGMIINSDNKDKHFLKNNSIPLPLAYLSNNRLIKEEKIKLCDKEGCIVLSENIINENLLDTLIDLMKEKVSNNKTRKTKKYLKNMSKSHKQTKKRRY